MLSGKKPLVTAVVPVYNHERFVVESIRSIIGQSYPEIELIVINDGSKDHSHEAVLTLLDECKRRFVRFDYINRANAGLTVTLNQALGMASGKYFGPLASDDVVLPNKFACLVEALEGNDRAAAAFGDASFIDQQGQRIYLDRRGIGHPSKTANTYGTFLEAGTGERDFDYTSGEFGSFATLLWSNYLPAMSSVVRTSCLRECGGWTVGNVLEDWEMWLKLSKRHTLMFVNEMAALYRVHGNNSFDFMKDKMLRAAMMLIAREREYCSNNGLSREWLAASSHQLYRFLRDGEAPLKEKIQELRSAGALSFLGSLMGVKLNAMKKQYLIPFSSGILPTS